MFWQNSFSVCPLTSLENWFSCLQDDPNYLDKFVTDGETWVSQYDPETKCQSSTSPLYWYYDNAPSHTTPTAAVLLANLNVTILLQANYRTDFAPSDFLALFNKVGKWSCIRFAWPLKGSNSTLFQRSRRLWRIFLHDNFCIG